LKLAVSDDFGWPTQAIESAAFALLAYYRWKQLPGSIPTTTGAAHAVLLGQLTQ
jgi:anhydro-N-acetylmuramic acid kinase